MTKTVESTYKQSHRNSIIIIYNILYLYNNINNSNNNKYNSGYQGLERKEKKELSFNGNKVPVVCDEKLLEICLTAV